LIRQGQQVVAGNYKADKWRARQDSNLRPLPSEGSTLSS
jgi:hypothetical protein